MLTRLRALLSTLCPLLAFALCGAAGVLRAQDLASVTGLVLDPRGRPLSNAAVTLIGVEPNRHAKTGPDGLFTITGLAPDNYSLDVQPPPRSFLSAARGRAVTAEFRPRPAVIQLEHRGGICGRLINQGHQPVDGATAVLLVRRLEPIARTWYTGPAHETLSERGGRFCFSSLDPGTYYLQARPALAPTAAGNPQPGALRSRREAVPVFYPNSLSLAAAVAIVVTPNLTHQLGDIVLPDELTFCTLIRVTPSPPASAAGTIAVRLRDGGGAILQPLSAGQDTYRFCGLPNGDYEAAADVGDQLLFGRVEFSIFKAHATKVILPLRPPVAVQGLLTFEPPRPPAEQLWWTVGLLPQGRAPRPQETLTAKALPGRFQLPLVATGPFTVRVPLPDPTLYIKSIDYGFRDCLHTCAIESAEELRVVLANGAASVSGQVPPGPQRPRRLRFVLGPDELPLPISPRDLRWQETDDGSFRFANLRPGTYRLLAQEPEPDYADLEPLRLQSRWSGGSVVKLAAGESKVMQLP